MASWVGRPREREMLSVYITYVACQMDSATDFERTLHTTTSTGDSLSKLRSML